ncbi:averantin oxidoreductase [Ilyonectria robusta]|uniref:averantin oxidoreductase n=1 Tax=Ilyonectria robusta TaxID=1079257 RepID=UPI001E8E127B|nr:averantin oxidoreductase [Ilyonectria robusta]KAH8684155.1 averantin oxidoreductase [Ilyonectria robusta]
MGAVEYIFTNLGTVALGCLASFVVYLVAVSVYNLYFHPLAKYPGPFFARISPIYSIWGLFRGRWPFDVHQLHLKYGPIVRTMPNELTFTDPQAWKDIYGHRQGHPQFHKDPIHVGSVQDIPGSTTLTMAGDSDHSRQRRALSHAFSQKALLEQESIIRGYVDLLIEKMKPFAATGKSANMCDWFNFTTFDIIGDMAFGEPFGCLRDGVFHAWVSLITQTIKAGAFEQATRRMFKTGGMMQKLLCTLIPSDLRLKRFQHLEMSKEKCLKRIEEGLRREHRDFLYYILRQNEKGGVSQDEIILNSALFIVAGSETTASLLSGLLMWLLRTPHAYKKLTEEIRSAFESADEMNSQGLQNLPYMNSCIDEALRIFPPVPTGLTRTVPENGDTVAGEFLPGGVTVSCHSWAATHSPHNFRRPDEFIPERWTDAAYADENREASQPFSLGPRGCIGKHMSYLELRLILGSLLWHYDVERADLDDPNAVDVWDPSGDLQHVKAFNTWAKPTLYVRIKAVQR